MKMNPAQTDAGSAAEMVTLLSKQREAFLRAGAPDAGSRKASLRRLRAAILANRKALSEAVSADFGNRSQHETDIMEVVVMASRASAR